MRVLRWTLLLTPAVLASTAASAATPAPVPPPVERTLFTWSGTVDREVVIVVRGRNVETRAAGLDASFAPRLDVRDDLPRMGGQLGVQRVDGRGEVEVLQQPSPRNDYTAMLRIRDPRSGRDNYRLVVSWMPVGNGWDPRDDRRRDDDWDRDRVRDGRDDRRGRDDDWGDRGRGRDDDWGNRGRGRGSFGQLSWSGDVDDVVDIHIQGRRVEYVTRSGKRLRNERLNLRGDGLPRRPVELALDVSRGRGSVLVLQQPHARNGYTAVIRVVDKRSGYGDYDFDLRWRTE